jgi:hypothetical protein
MAHWKPFSLETILQAQPQDMCLLTDLLGLTENCSAASLRYCQGFMLHVCPVAGSRVLWETVACAYPSLGFGLRCAPTTAPHGSATSCAVSERESIASGEHEGSKGRFMVLEDENSMHTALRALERGVTWQTADQFFALWASLWRCLDPALVTPRATAQVRTFPPPPGAHTCAATDTQAANGPACQDTWLKQQVHVVQGLMRLLTCDMCSDIADDTDYNIYPAGVCLASTRVVDVGSKDMVTELLALQRTLLISIRALPHQEINDDKELVMANGTSTYGLPRPHGLRIAGAHLVVHTRNVWATCFSRKLLARLCIAACMLLCRWRGSPCMFASVCI